MEVGGFDDAAGSGGSTPVQDEPEYEGYQAAEGSDEEGELVSEDEEQATVKDNTGGPQTYSDDSEGEIHSDQSDEEGEIGDDQQVWEGEQGGYRSEDGMEEGEVDQMASGSERQQESDVEGDDDNANQISQEGQEDDSDGELADSEAEMEDPNMQGQSEPVNPYSPMDYDSDDVGVGDSGDEQEGARDDGTDVYNGAPESPPESPDAPPVGSPVQSAEGDGPQSPYSPPQSPDGNPLESRSASGSPHGSPRSPGDMSLGSPRDSPPASPVGSGPVSPGQSPTGSPAYAQEGSPPGSPVGSRQEGAPGSPTESGPQSPSGSRPQSPDRSGPQSPVGNGPQSPVGSGPQSPAGSGPQSPTGSGGGSAGSDGGSRSNSPAGSRPQSPPGSGPVSPAGSEPRSPAADKPASPAGSAGSPLASPKPSQEEAKSPSGSPPGSPVAQVTDSGAGVPEDQEDRPKEEAAAAAAAKGSDDEDESDKESNVGELIADIFGSSDEDEEFEGFGEADVEAPSKKEKKKLATIMSDDEDNEMDEAPAPVPADEVVPDISSDEEADQAVRKEVEADRDDFISDFDLMLEKKKEMTRKHKRKKKDVDIINDNDDLIAELIQKMKQVAEEDRDLNKQKKPATRKMTMLPMVMNQLKKTDLHIAFLDCGILNAVTEWLAPLPDKSLPHLRIREALLQTLVMFPSISSESLKMSGVGKAVMYLYKHPKEIKINKERAGKLINEWSRPIFNLSSNYKFLSREEREQRDYEQLPKKRRLSSDAGMTPRRDIDKALTGEEKALRPGEKGWVMRARVPQPSNKDYVVRPKWTVEEQMPRASKKSLNRYEKRLREFKEKKKNSKSQRAVAISIEGRNMAI